MKINYDCMKDVLLFLEDKIKYVNDVKSPFQHTEVDMMTIVKELVSNKNYSEDEVKYAIEMLLKEDYVVAGNTMRNKDNTYSKLSITDISWQGHDFLNTKTH